MCLPETEPLLLALLALLVHDANAQTVHDVPGDFPDLRSAIDAANDGDTIELGSGDWPLPSTGVVADLTLHGAGIGTTRIQVQDEGTTGMLVSSVVEISDLSIMGLTHGRPLLVEGAGSVSLVRVALSEGLAVDTGGLVLVRDSAVLVATDSSFADGRALHGGAIAFGGNSTGSITDCTFSRNEVVGAGSDGGAVRLADNAQITITGSTFDDNHNRTHIGGALALLYSGTRAMLVDCTFLQNTAAAGGGAVHVFNGGTLTVVGGLFRGNEATLGGAVACGGPTSCVLEVEGATFEDDTAVENGGHVFVVAGNTTFRDSTFLRGVAGGNGGAIAVLGAFSSLALADTRFEGNHAGAAGGAVFVEAAALSALRPWMCTNTAGTNGGALAASGPSPTTLTNGTFLANSAGSAGGAVWLDERDARLSWSTFVDDSSAGGLPAVSHDGAPEVLELDDSVFSGASSPAVGTEGNGSVRLIWSAFWDVLEPTSPDVDETDRVTLSVDPFPGLVASDCPAYAIPVFEGELVDAGDPTRADLDGSPADLGATGGPEAHPPLWVDGDADGVVQMWDCDDADPGRSPLVAEIVGDGIDQDCDAVDATDPDDTDLPTDTDTDTDTDTGLDPEPDPPVSDRPSAPPEDAPVARVVGCACDAAGPGAGWFVVPLGLLWRRRAISSSGQRKRSCIPG